MDVSGSMYRFNGQDRQDATVWHNILRVIYLLIFAFVLTSLQASGADAGNSDDGISEAIVILFRLLIDSFLC
jgi:hypothetical protein